MQLSSTCPLFQWLLNNYARLWNFLLSFSGTFGTTNNFWRNLFRNWFIPHSRGVTRANWYKGWLSQSTVWKYFLLLFSVFISHFPAVLLWVWHLNVFWTWNSKSSWMKSHKIWMFHMPVSCFFDRQNSWIQIFNNYFYIMLTWTTKERKDYLYPMLQSGIITQTLEPNSVMGWNSGPKAAVNFLSASLCMESLQEVQLRMLNLIEWFRCWI